VVGRAGILKHFPDISEADCERAYADIGRSLDAADTSFNVLAVRVGSETLLVDAGEGGRPAGGLLPESLRRAGIPPQTVTHVLITHTHGDHVQGLLSAVGEPVFPNARYVLSKPEMAFWQQRIDGGIVDHGAILRLAQAQGLRLIEMDEQIIPGVAAVPLPGHTPGHIGVLIGTGPDRLINLTDLLHSPMQFARPEWSANYDLDPVLSAAARREALGRAAGEGLLALFYHLTFPGLGRVRRAGDGFTWEPLAASQ